MAWDFSRFKIKLNFNFISRLSARARIFLLVLGVIAILFIVYLGTIWLSGGTSTVGPSKVATAPQSVQSIPGGQLTPEYYRALSQANVQAAEQAKITGGSAVPTLVNIGEQSASPGSCNIICSDKMANVRTLLDDWAKQGKIGTDVADQLDASAKQGVVPEAYASSLNALVKQGKLTPEQARELLEEYKKQHAGALLQKSATTMDDLIKSGQIPLAEANELLAAQKAGMSTAEYAKRLQQMVKEGKISPQVAQQLLAQYAQQRAKEITSQSIATLQDWAKQGQIMADVEKRLIDLEGQMVSIDTFSSEVSKFVTQGKLAPVVAEKIIDEYLQQKSAIGSLSELNDMIANAEAAAYQEIQDLLKAEKITQETAQQLADMIKNDVSMEEFVKTVQSMVSDNKLTGDIAKLKIADYEKVKAARAMAARLAALQQNNATNAQYTQALKDAVAAKLIAPEQAADLMRQYQATTSKPIAPTTLSASSSEFAALQKKVQQGAGATEQVATSGQFEGAQAQTVQETDQDRMARVQALVTAMSGQAQQLVGSWQPVPMAHKAGAEEKPKKSSADAAAAGTAAGAASTSSTSSLGSSAPIIKAGTIIFAVLDTAVNSDYPDSPVMATIVEGQYKGAKLLGKLMTTKGVSGQMDRVTLNFTIMNLDVWPQSKTVTAYAIDPDTARTVLASSVNYHYMMRFGAIMATSFVQGYGTAVSSSGATTGIGLNGTQTTANPQFSPANKLAIAIGQIGQTLGSVTQNYVNTPPTVRVDSGVGLGILFMSDVS